jgi:hypothetical protein
MNDDHYKLVREDEKKALRIIDLESENKYLRGLLANAIHYPDCWDTACYSTLDEALKEAGTCKKFVCQCQLKFVNSIRVYDKKPADDKNIKITRIETALEYKK